MENIKVKYCEDSDKFRQPALTFERDGYYTSAPIGTTAYIEYWDEELKRSIHGYTAPDGEYISGYFYFYLNYSRIIVTKQTRIKGKNNRERTIVKRVESFPRFYDYDRTYFDMVEEAEIQGKHLVVLKARGKGFSYKGASMLARNFYCIPKSKSYAAAAETEFLVKDGLLTKVSDMMSFIDINTAWGKKRQKKDTTMHRRASFVLDDDLTGIKSEQGWGSEIIGISLKNDANKIRGKRAKLILFEEAGKFPNLKDAWQIARPGVEDNNIAFGLLIAYGTGGEDSSNYEGLKELFYEPLAYNALAINNIWDEGANNTTCGFFVPQYYNMEGYDRTGSIQKGRRFMDDNGNSDINFSVKWVLKERDIIIENATDKHSIDRYIAERPLNPVEATLSITGNIFPKKDLIMHLSSIRTSKKIKEFKQVGDLYYDKDGVLKWEIDPKIKDLTKYRLSANDDKTGGIVIWEHPVDDPPYGLYILGVDPYDHDQSGTNSLGSCFVYKRIQKFESYFDLPVAEYTGRPETADQFYEKVRRLALYYKGRILYENEKKGLFTYFDNKNCAYLLADQPGTIKDVIQDSKVNRIKGIHMNKPLKDWGEGLFKDWLIEEYAPGKRNLTKLFSEPLLEELIAYNSEGNFDRVIAMIMVMIELQELHYVEVKKRKDTVRKTLFKDTLFSTEDDNKLNIFNF